MADGSPMLTEARRLARELAGQGLTACALVGRMDAWLAETARASGLAAPELVEALDPTVEASGTGGSGRCPRCGTGWRTATGRPPERCPGCGARIVRRGASTDMLAPFGRHAPQGFALDVTPVGTGVWEWRRDGTSWVTRVRWLAGVDDMADAARMAPGATLAPVVREIGRYATRDEAVAATARAFAGRRGQDALPEGTGDADEDGT